MSLILEALRKSERERRLGDAPSIGSPVMAVRRRRNWLPLLVALIVLGLLLLWWLQRQAPAPTNGNSPVPVQKTESTPATRNPAEFESVPAQSAQPAADSRRPSRKPQPRIPGTDVASDPVATTPGAAAVTSPTARSGPVRMPSPAQTPASGNPTAPLQAEPAAQPPAAESASVSKPESGPAQVPIAPTRPADALAMVWELPLATRRDLPPIAISMHVFAEDPAQRFIILNGERQTEGAVVGGLILKEIRRDGAVFEFDGQRFLYPRGGR